MEGRIVIPLPTIDDRPPMYQFADEPLSQEVFRVMLPILVTQKVFKRDHIVDIVKKYHLDNGGLPSKASAENQTKKALKDLYELGKIEKAAAHNHWRWATATKEAITPIATGGLESTPIEEITEPEKEIIADDGVFSSGTGSGCVYVYFFPSYKELSELKGQERFPVKVGMTTLGKASVRVGQQKTSMPEYPVIGYVYRTNRPKSFESMLHTILTERKRKLTDAPGNEWFSSTPEEIHSILEWVSSGVELED